MTRPLEEVQNGGAALAMHLHYNDGHGYVYRAVLEPRITVHKFSPKRKSKKPFSRVFMVQGIETEFLTFEEAWLAVDKIDRTAQQDAEWERAAPKKKPAFIPGMEQ